VSARLPRTLPRAVTIARRHLTREALAVDAELLDDETRAELAARPRTRAECVDGPRPCAFAGCKHHLALDINPATGAIKINHPDREVWELEETCALDVADRGGVTLEKVGALLNITRERVRQIEIRAQLELKRRGRGLDDGTRRRTTPTTPRAESALETGSSE